jgi:hypothetical protein
MGTTAISGRPKTLGNTSQALVPCDQHDHNTHYYVYVWHVCKSYLTLGTSTILGMSYIVSRTVSSLRQWLPSHRQWLPPLASCAVHNKPQLPGRKGGLYA